MVDALLLMTKPATYASAGVDIDAANRATEKIKELARATFNERTLSEIGSFGGMFDGAFPGMRQPVLVASADGVGTKLKIAFATGIHNTIGRFFLDYIATGKLAPDTVAAIVEGIANGCRENGSVLLGGETAEMPGFYADGEYDVAGFIVGVVDRERVIDGHAIAPDDIVLGLPSVGLHTNGYSLARKLFFEDAGCAPDTYLDDLGETIGAALLRPHVSYLRALEGVLDSGAIKGLAHITGGGLLENIPRILPEGTSVEIKRGSWPVLPIFEMMQRLGSIEDAEMYRTFNMGIGMVVVCAQTEVAEVTSQVRERGTNCFEIGRVTEGPRDVVIE